MRFIGGPIPDPPAPPCLQKWKPSLLFQMYAVSGSLQHCTSLMPMKTLKTMKVLQIDIVTVLFTFALLYIISCEINVRSTEAGPQIKCVAFDSHRTTMVSFLSQGVTLCAHLAKYCIYFQKRQSKNQITNLLGGGIVRSPLLLPGSFLALTTK